MPKKISIDELARMTKKGLDEQASKQNLLRTEMQEGFSQLRSQIGKGFGDITEEMRELKAVLPPTLRTVGKLELEVKELTKRLERVERKVGLGK
jgi:hypothetical protein